MKDGVRIGLAFGGRSVEHEVSVTSAREVYRALEGSSMVAVPLAVTGEGVWLGTERSQAILESDAARVPSAADPGMARLVVDAGGSGLLDLAADGSPRPLDLDVIFPLIHGWGGEDGRLQGALELAGVPYVGSGVVGSAVAMDKGVCKRVLEAHGLPVGPWLSATAAEWATDPRRLTERIDGELGWPVFVKPANGGSSIGITRVAEAGALAAAMELAYAHDREAVVERGIDAREIECAVLGNDVPEASGLGEIVPSREFYDYEAKYVDGTSELLIPAPLTDEATEELRRLALEAFRALKLRGFARIDFLVERNTGKSYLNEANTLPGFTPISMFPKLWESRGVAYPQLVGRLVELALEGAGRRVH